MQIDFSEIDTSAYNEMAIAMFIFVLGIAAAAWLISAVLSQLKVPAVVVNTIITLIVLGCLYYGARYFL
ncbi:hypothetical protein [Planomicrobium sp. CPCC 101079]|uniref:hypothetical protein n=1 Tax=Planomicrobium sp. CPCC 101079 TaxID=2599618 RepID=UPI0011B70A76|nr:hypothetical protein [Planomicrobium sp. CPCC 101079]TWT13285.1 hypothetical protein FQV28_02300 [Planomicrobium sp. CPCC 101079]